MKSATTKSAALQTFQQTVNLTSAYGKSLYNDDYPVQAYKLCLLGATNAELAGFFNVTKRTITTWKKFHSAFNDAITRGKKVADMEVAHSLYQATIDRIITTRQAIKCKEIYYDENGKRVEKERIEIINVEKHVPACFRSQQFWLRNRNPKLWGGKFDDGDDVAPESVQLNLGSGHNPLSDEVTE
ncbi:hypothetical protein LRS05_13370 [Flavobacterium sp. J372]|uniref:hypothetical protein n=1 Tax=Flavobacterium sp. J372 TaxID=2898436 RepID=UPI0021511901|nr:hypothetical protein [Flavobacterium sp. J372]MCR5863054.1 hypothetical protein [Flavobacterium sp. J372]